MWGPFSLKGKFILVTGSSSGIGRQVAISFSRAGATLGLVGRSRSRIEETLGALEGSGHSCFILDITDTGAVDYTTGQVPECHGLVHAAGLLKIVPARAIAAENLQEILDVNFIAPFRLTQTLLNKRKIRSGGSVVFVSSVNGAFINTKGFGAYSSSKAALGSMVRTLALEYAGKGIRFNAVAPGMIKTEMYDQLAKLLGEQNIAEDKKRYPLGDYGEPEDVANACLFLASDASKWITGSSLVVDGGLTIN